MRRNIVAGNWKMNKTLDEGITLATEIKTALQGKKTECEVILGVPFTHIVSVVNAIKDSKINTSAQNCSDKPSGAFTGEVSSAMIASTGATHCIIGHSERRSYYGETFTVLRNKVVQALENNLRPIFCIGETKEERQAGNQNAVVKAQLEGSVFDLSAEEFSRVIIAYEPVWAIGTGLTATSEQAQEIHAYIRSLIADRYGKQVADDTSILYGGSCNPSNAKELFAKPDVDGGLIGGASLKASDFVAIIDSF